MIPSPPYRKRLQHYDLIGHAHLLTFSCYKRMPLLGKDRSRVWFVAALEKARQRADFDLWAWVIMPEHVHLLLWPRTIDYQISRILSLIKRPVALRAVAYLQKHATSFLVRLHGVTRTRTAHHFWQAGGGYDKNLWEPKAIHKAVAYIHANPIRRGLVDTAEAWRWSSAADWAGNEDVPLLVDQTLPTLDGDGS